MMKDVEPGQRFRETKMGVFGQRLPDWVVYHVWTGVDGLRHARLYLAQDPTATKTVSVAILGDRRRFVAISEQPLAAE